MFFQHNLYQYFANVFSKYRDIIISKVETETLQQKTIILNKIKIQNNCGIFYNAKKGCISMSELRIGLVGTGMIGRTHIERINNRLQGAKVIACADANIDFCKSVAEKYGIKAYDKGEDMIASDDIDAVIVTTLDPFHTLWLPSKPVNTFSAKNRSLRKQTPADALSMLKSLAANSLFR